MSHTVKIQTKFTQIDSLKKAFEHFGWKITENSKARTYASDPQANKKYDFVAVNPEQAGSMTFDLGITQNSKGELEIFGDMWGGSISRTLGNGLDKLKQEYAFRVIEQKYAYEGAVAIRDHMEDGTQEIKVEKY